MCYAGLIGITHLSASSLYVRINLVSHRVNGGPPFLTRSRIAFARFRFVLISLSPLT